MLQLVRAKDLNDHVREGHIIFNPEDFDNPYYISCVSTPETPFIPPMVTEHPIKRDTIEVWTSFMDENSMLIFVGDRVKVEGYGTYTVDKNPDGSFSAGYLNLYDLIVDDTLKVVKL